MKLGAEPKNVAVLVGLLATAAYFYTSQDSTTDAPAESKKAAVAAPVEQPKPAVVKGPAVARPNTNKRSSQEYKPVLKSKKAEDRIDPATVDPTLRLELISRLANVPIQGGSRPVFEFGGAPPPPKAPDPGKIKPAPAKQSRFIGPMPKPTDPPKIDPAKTEPPKPKAPPIPLKYYGFTSPRAGGKRAFFMEGEDVHVANEGELVKRRYKIVRINLNSVVMEDTDFKDQQTLPLVEQMQ